MPDRSIHLIGVPLDLGAGRRGVDMGPSAVRISGLAERLERLGCRVVDHGDLDAPGPETRGHGSPHKRYIDEIARICRRVYAAVSESLAQDAVPVVIGGDHSLAAGSVAAAADHARARGRRLGVLWLDAHGDMNTPETSTSGNVHGMPLAALTGAEPAELAAIGGAQPVVDPDRVALVGVRSLDEREKNRVRASGVHVFTMQDVDRHGMATVAEQAMAVLGRDGAALHLSIDVDACDPSIAPGVGTPVRGGLTWREAHLLMEVVAAGGRLTSLDLVEINPILDVHNQTAELGAGLVLSALGQRIL
jgi:arginase